MAACDAVNRAHRFSQGLVPVMRIDAKDPWQGTPSLFLKSFAALRMTRAGGGGRQDGSTFRTAYNPAMKLGLSNPTYRPVWLILFVVAGLAALVGISRMREGVDAAGHDDPGPIGWSSDLAAAKVASAKEGKPILLYFTAAWCGPCQEMRKTTWVDERVVAAVRQKSLPVRIDVDAQPDVSREYQVQGFPLVELVDASGNRKVVTDHLVDAKEFLENFDAALR